MKERVFAADAHGRERFRPEIANFENERNLAGESDPPPGEADEQLWRRRDDDIGARESEAAECGGQAERGVVADALVRFAIGKRPEPGAEDLDAADFFPIGEAA